MFDFRTDQYRKVVIPTLIVLAVMAGRRLPMPRWQATLHILTWTRTEKREQPVLVYPGDLPLGTFSRLPIAHECSFNVKDGERQRWVKGDHMPFLIKDVASRLWRQNT